MLWALDVLLGLAVVALGKYTLSEGAPMTPVSPAVVAFVRGLILSVLAAAAGAATLYASDNGDKLHRYWWAPLVLLALRSVEGAVDKARGQAPQAGLGGSKPANPADYTS